MTSAKLLSDVRKNYSKTIRTSRDTTVKHMDPSHLELPLQRGGDQAKGSATGKRSVTWLCIPYFSLEELLWTPGHWEPGSIPTPNAAAVSVLEELAEAGYASGDAADWQRREGYVLPHSTAVVYRPG